METVAEKQHQNSNFKIADPDKCDNFKHETPRELIEYLVDIGWSQSKIARRFGMEPAMVSRLRHGQRVRCDYQIVDGLRDLVTSTKTFRRK